MERNKKQRAFRYYLSCHNFCVISMILTNVRKDAYIFVYKKYQQALFEPHYKNTKYARDCVPLLPGNQYHYQYSNIGIGIDIILLVLVSV